MIHRQALLHFCDHALNVTAFQDYAPNGLQVEGKSEIRRIVSAVTASYAAIDFACQYQADALLVHHGMFWKNEPITICGWKKRRIARLLAHDINMIAYHLPLDAHPEWGNNAMLAEMMHWSITERTGMDDLVFIGHTATPIRADELAAALGNKLKRPPLLLGNGNKTIQRIAWCSGGAQNFFQLAIDTGVDAFITGEVSEAQFHLAHECNTVFFAAGHHATERLGIQALTTRLAKQFDLEYVFFDDNNPV